MCYKTLTHPTVIALALLQSAIFAPAYGGPMDVSGQFAVNEQGAATYTIPIQVPPGTGGMEPSLALAYNSQAGNGLLGAGWSLSGLSAVTRCPQTMAQDGARGSVNYDLNDRYCLDGQRLIAISGANGGNGTEYRTEQESFAKVLSYGSAGNGPASFKIWTKSGLVMEYGATANSAIEAQGKTSIAVWAVNKVSDTKGNYFTVTYTKDNANGAYYPARIDYTGNANTGLAPNNSVQFTYESRPDVVPGYLAGSLTRATYRLLSITTYLQSAIARNYTFNYSLSVHTGRSRLSSLKECDGMGNCLAASTFSSFDPGTKAFQPPIHKIAYFGTKAGEWTDDDTYPRMLADVNGDGLPDIVGFASDGVYVSLNAGTSFAAPTRWVAYFGTKAGEWTNHSIYPRMLADVNGDGLPDIVGFASDGVYVSLNTGTSFAAPTPWVAYFGTKAGGWTNHSIYPRMLADVNGDGLPDIVGFASDGVYVTLNTGTSFAAPTQWVAHYGTLAGGWTNRNTYPRMLADVNGDGLPDIVGFASDGVYISIASTQPLVDSIAGFTNGIGNSVTLNYKSLVDSTFYTKDANARFPVQNLQFPMHAVSSVSVSNGIGGTQTTSYKYGGLKAEVGTAGRGLSGFAWLESTQVETGLTARTQYRQDWPYVGLPARMTLSKQGAGNGGLLKESNTTYGCLDPASGAACAVAAGKRYFPYASQSVEKSYDLDGTVFPTVTTTQEFDVWGNPTVVKVNTSDGHEKVTTNTYRNDASKWHLGRLLRSKVQSTAP